MDYETLSNCFIAVFEEYKTKERKIFTIHALKNDTLDLLNFLMQNISNNECHISFNGLSFDSQITEYLLDNAEGLLDRPADNVAKLLYAKAQDIINTQNNGGFPGTPEYKLKIRQIDLFKLNHWDNPAKRSSLKWIQYSMDWPNIKDMPIHHSTEIKSLSEIDTIIDYCINDVESTKNIFLLSKDLIALRKTLTLEYGINLYNASEPKIAKELFLYFLSKTTGISKYDLKQLRTSRSEIIVKDIILPYVKFENPEFIKMHEKFKAAIINPENTKGGFKYSMIHKGVKTDFGLGGVHGATKSGIYKSSNDFIIMSSDVKSYYPNLAIRNKWSPAHLPHEEFCSQYEWFYDERVKIPKKDPKNYVYKIILNATFGLSIDKNSFLYDPQFGMQVTINGQLLLMMLYEKLSKAIPDSVPLMQNTDGLEMIIPRESKELYLKICKEWEEQTLLELEHDEYQKLILADVNNYIGILNYKELDKESYLEQKIKTPYDLFKIEKGRFYYASTKCKGRFEFNNLALHKNKSNLIVPKAVFNYFVHSISPKLSLEQNTNILDYCTGVKIKGNWTFHQTCIVDREITYEKLQNTLRYYINTEGCKIIKKNNEDRREIQVEAGEWLQELFIKYEEKPFEEYKINEKYYLHYIEKEIENIEPKPTSQLAIDFFK